ncbi:MAG: DUF2993 domain-containing protein [Candidatus Dormibacteraeota bacterium]|nr:DUF2993 domain-containing protein [Candidatus Dormibacteraeota bacterium]
MKALIGLLAVLVLLAGALVAADRIGESYASSLIAEQLTSQLRLSQNPKVRITGVPFLTQWASGHYQEVDVAIPSVTAQSITVSDVQATIRNVQTKPFITSTSDVTAATAGSVDLDGVVAFSEIPLPSGFTAAASGSQLKVSGSVTVLGATVPVSATENVTLHGSTVSFNPTSVQAQAGGFQVNVAGSVASQLRASVNVSGLPFGVHLTGVAVGPSGLVATAQGRNVTFASA